MNSHSTIPIQQPFSLTDDVMPDLRIGIDLIATVRARILKIKLTANLIVRPAEQTDQASENKADHIHDLSEQVEGLKMVSNLLVGRNDKLNAEIVRFISTHASAYKTLLRRVSDLLDSTSNLHRAAKKPGDTATPDLDKEIRDFAQRSDGMFEIITQFCSQLWTEVDNCRAEAASRSAEMTNTVDKLLLQVEKIGKHVRLVSLNASVEAARIGDDGKGLSVIAFEFKSLAEDIQKLAASGRDSIARLN